MLKGSGGSRLLLGGRDCKFAPVSRFARHNLRFQAPRLYIIDSLEGDNYFEEAPEEILRPFRKGFITSKVGTTPEESESLY